MSVHNQTLVMCCGTGLCCMTRTSARVTDRLVMQQQSSALASGHAAGTDTKWQQLEVSVPRIGG